MFLTSKSNLVWNIWFWKFKRIIFEFGLISNPESQQVFYNRSNINICKKNSFFVEPLESETIFWTQILIETYYRENRQITADAMTC